MRLWQPIGDLWQPICNENPQQVGSFVPVTANWRVEMEFGSDIVIDIGTDLGFESKLKQKPSNSKLRSNRIANYIDIGIDIEI